MRVQELKKLGAEIVDRAQKGGADVAEVLLVEGANLSAKVRMGAPEIVQEATSRGIGLRVILGSKSATAHSSDLSPNGLEFLIRDAIELASLSQPDEFAVAPDPSLLAKSFPDLDLYDATLADFGAAEALDL